MSPALPPTGRVVFGATVELEDQDEGAARDLSDRRRGRGRYPRRAHLDHLADRARADRQGAGRRGRRRPRPARPAATRSSRSATSEPERRVTAVSGSSDRAGLQRPRRGRSRHQRAAGCATSCASSASRARDRRPARAQFDQARGDRSARAAAAAAVIGRARSRSAAPGAWMPDIAARGASGRERSASASASADPSCAMPSRIARGQWQFVQRERLLAGHGVLDRRRTGRWSQYAARSPAWGGRAAVGHGAEL